MGAIFRLCTVHTNLTPLSDDITVHGTLITLSTANPVVFNKYSRK